MDKVLVAHFCHLLRIHEHALQYVIDSSYVYLKYLYVSNNFHFHFMQVILEPHPLLPPWGHHLASLLQLELELQAHLVPSNMHH